VKSFIPAIGEILTAAAAVRSIVSHRIWGERPPDGEPIPDVLLIEVSGVPSHILVATTPPWRKRMSIECRAPTIGVADALKNAVLGALSNVDGTQHGGILIQSCRPQFEYGGYDNAVFRRILDFEIVACPPP
jgi:hypothetical protein